MVALVVGDFRCYTDTGEWWEIFSVLKCLWWWETLRAIIIIMIYYGHIMALVVGDSRGYHNNYDILWPYYGSGGGRLSVLSYMALVVGDSQCYHIWLWWWETLSAIIYGFGGRRLSVLSYIALVVGYSQCYHIYGSGGGRLSVL